mmetsp:Transcript_37383/g.93850  ORF Transcript_37383/g.93850 Transcript_37383/m.93850 type:complete len:259 (+) Transcript_37383:86-862(+)
MGARRRRGSWQVQRWREPSWAASAWRPRSRSLRQCLAGCRLRQPRWRRCSGWGRRAWRPRWRHGRTRHQERRPASPLYAHPSSGWLPATCGRTTPWTSRCLRKQALPATACGSGAVRRRRPPTRPRQLSSTCTAVDSSAATFSDFAATATFCRRPRGCPCCSASTAARRSMGWRLRPSPTSPRPRGCWPRVGCGAWWSATALAAVWRCWRCSAWPRRQPRAAVPARLRTAAVPLWPPPRRCRGCPWRRCCSPPGWTSP